MSIININSLKSWRQLNKTGEYTDTYVLNSLLFFRPCIDANIHVPNMKSYIPTKKLFASQVKQQDPAQI